MDRDRDRETEKEVETPVGSEATLYDCNGMAVATKQTLTQRCLLHSRAPCRKTTSCGRTTVAIADLACGTSRCELVVATSAALYSQSSNAQLTTAATCSLFSRQARLKPREFRECRTYSLRAAHRPHLPAPRRSSLQRMRSVPLS